MKSERRHDLETNELAIRMQEWIDRLKPYASQIALVIVGVVVLAYIASAWGGATAAKEQEAWDEFTLASYSTDPELNGMRLLAENENFVSTPVPEWAFLAWADQQVFIASRTYLTDREGTTKRLEGARDIFKNLAEGAGNAQVQDRARFGLAQALEMLGKVDEAKAAYGLVRGDLSALAEARVEALDNPERAKAVEWLAAAELPKQESASSTGMTGGTKPSFEASIPGNLPTTNPLDGERSMEDILSEALGPSKDDNRYGESDVNESSETETEEADAEDDAESTGDATEEPTSTPAER